VVGRRALIVVAAIAASALAGAARAEVARAQTPVAVDGKFEVVFDVPGADLTRADDVDLAADFTSPAHQTTRVAGFFDGARFRVRFSPRTPGHWRYQVRAGRRDVAAGQFDVVARAGHGRVHRDPAAPHRLVFDDGSPFYPLGENRFNVYEPRWNWQNQSIEEYLAAMHKAGMNTLRLFMVVDCEDEEAPDRVQKGCLETAPGRFSPAAAALYDRILAAAEANDLYVIFGVWAIGFTPHETWKSWDDNPYSRARGGPLAAPNDFFTRTDVRALQAKKLRYIAARWGWSPHLLAIDLLNEPEWDGAIPETVWIPWAEAMASVWRSIDVYGHLVTAGSVGLQWNIGSGDERPWYGSALNDLVEWHLYGKETYDVHALSTTMVHKVEETWRFDKPILVGEFAYGGEDKPLYDHTHVGIWSATFAGAGVLMHTAPPFNLDSDEPMTPERARHVAGLARFLARLSPVPHRPAQLPASPAGTRALALRSDDEVALWLMAPAHGYGAPLDDARVIVGDLAPGSWHERFIDELDGSVTEDRLMTVTASRTLALAVPRFARHVAALITRAHPTRN